MTVSPVYEASPIKRTRSTRAEVEGRREVLLAIIEAARPMTIRQFRARFLLEHAKALGPRIRFAAVCRR
jgi:hypothetical protein